MALAYNGHRHHAAAAVWFASLDDDLAYFCRITQLSFLRLITHPSVMGEDLRTQAEAWRAYDAFFDDECVSFHPEPDCQHLESVFRRLTSRRHSSSRQWPDAYLAAFAETADVILVTFDGALHQMNGGKSLLLK